MAYWTDTADGHHCTRHDFTFKRGEVCHSCVVDPGEAPGGTEIDEAEVAGLRARVSEYQSRARTCWRKVLELDEEDSKREENVAIKWSAEAVKWARLAEERQDKIDAYTRDDRLVRKAEKLAGVSN